MVEDWCLDFDVLVLQVFVVGVEVVGECVVWVYFDYVCGQGVN